MLDFTGKAVLVTGGAGGIGSAVGCAAARAGARVMLVDQDAAGADVAAAIRASGGECDFFQADVSRSEAVQAYVERTLQRFGGIDSFVNNAGMLGPVATLADYDESAFDRLLAVNVRGIFLGLKHVLPVMLRAGRGTVVNTSSTAAATPSPGMGPYAATKAAILGLSAAAAGEAGPHGVRVNAVCPGAIDAGIYTELRSALSTDAAKFDAQVRANIPTGRLTTADEVADTILFLASALSGNINGASITIDGARGAVSGSFSGRASGVPSPAARSHD